MFEIDSMIHDAVAFNPRPGLESYLQHAVVFLMIHREMEWRRAKNFVVFLHTGSLRMILLRDSDYEDDTYTIQELVYNLVVDVVQSGRLECSEERWFVAAYRKE